MENQGQYIDRVVVEQTGGGCMVDFVELKDGRVVGINDECVVLYPSRDAFYSDELFPHFDRPSAATETRGPADLGTFIRELQVEYPLDLLTLTTGEVLGIDAESICLYADVTRVFSGDPDCIIASISLR